MKAERWRQVDELFDAALERNPTERAAFLSEACDGDDELRREVVSLLAAHERAGSFIETPATDSTAESVIKRRAHLKAGQRIGHYEIVSRLGAGGMGEVYLARDTKLTRHVAIKLLPTTLIADSQARTRFLREAQLAATLDHPNICTIHEIGEDAGQCFIVMQYIEGQTLKDVMTGQPLHAKSLLSISRQIADALSAAHRKGVIHRDIKSTNIIISARGQAKVLDFGLAKLMDEDLINASRAEAELTQTGMILGTPAYMSPEQACGQRADHRSDIFSLGVLMYEMAAGQLPFKAKSQPETLNAIINEPHRPASKSNREVSAELSSIIDRAIAKDPAQRYQSMNELLEDLSRAAQAMGFSGSNASDGIIVPVVAPQRKRRALLPRRSLAWLFLLLVVILGITVLLWHPGRGQPEQTMASIRSIAVLPFKPISGSARDEYLELGMADALIAKLSGVKQLIVRPTSAVRKYAGFEQDPLVAGREQRVDAVIDANVQMLGDRINVTVRLLRVADGSALWSFRCGDACTDVFAAQDAISEQIAQAIKVSLNDEERKLLAKHYTDNKEAYQDYLKGRYYWNKRTAGEISKAILYFQSAIDRDPTYALAYAGLSDAYYTQHIYDPAHAPQAIPRARAAALKALEIDEMLTAAHASLASLKWIYDWDFAGGEAEFKRAIELDQNYATTHHWYALCLSSIGRHEEAISEIKRAAELDPLSPMISTDVGLVLSLARKYDEAIAQFRETLKMTPDFFEAHHLLGQTLIFKGMYAEALDEYQKISDSGAPISWIEGEIGYAYAKLGRSGEALKILRELQRQDKSDEGVVIAEQAFVYAGLGDKDEAFKLLKELADRHDLWLRFLKTYPLLDDLRADERFAELVRHAGLAP